MGVSSLSSILALLLIVPVLCQFDLLPAPCHHHHRGTRYPHRHSHHLPHRFHHHYPRVHHLSQSPPPHDDWQQVPLPPGIPGPFWTSGGGGSGGDSLENSNQFEGGGGGGGDGGYIPVLRVVEAYGPGTGPEGEGPVGGGGSNEESQPDSAPPTQQTTSTKVTSSQIESIKMIHTQDPTNLPSPSTKDDSNYNTESSREYGSPGVTYTRFRLPEPHQLITGDSPGPSSGSAGSLHPGVVYHLEGPSSLSGGQPMIISTDPRDSPNKKKLKKTKAKKTKKKLKPTAILEHSGNYYHATTSTEDPLGPYSVNKIIVIEEDGGGSSGMMTGPPPLSPTEPQIERPLIDSRFHFPGPTSTSTSPPIKTIKDLHDRLNATLLQPVTTTPMPPLLAELIQKISNAPTTTTVSSVLIQPSFGNDTHLTKHFTGASGYYVKANRFQFENSWNGLGPTTTTTTSTTTSTTTEAPRIAAPAQTTPPVVYFTSQRTYIPPPPTKSPPVTSTSSPSKIVPIGTRLEPSPGQNTYSPAARKHFGSESSSSARHELPPYGRPMANSAAVTVDMTKIVSIIIGFCVAMMALAAVILMVLHRDTVTGHIRQVVESIEARYPHLRRAGGPAAGSSPGSSSAVSPQGHEAPFPQPPPPTAQSPSTEHRRVSVPIPPPPPPPPLPPGPPPSQGGHDQPNHHHLIEQIIGRPAETGFTNKKCRQYFSRVHRWVPKRPPLPEDLKTTSVTRVHL